jgi:1-deoxy-D-xylulose-5-phosphate reductoisomerase
VLNAANEVAVEAFLAGRVRFVDIPVIIEDTLNRLPSEAVRDLEHILQADRSAREHASSWVEANGS